MRPCLTVFLVFRYIFSGKILPGDFLLVNPDAVMYDKREKQGGVYEAA